MSAGDGLQPDVLWGQDSGASSDCLLLAAALVPGDPGPGTRGNSVHHHYLHAEVMRAADQGGACCFPWLVLTLAGLMLMPVWTGVCSGSMLYYSGLYYSVGMVA